MNCGDAWLGTLHKVLNNGQLVMPRGMTTLEVEQHTTVVDLLYPVMSVKERGLSYKFCAAEAFWILSGDDSVSGIAPYNSHIQEFSDDGQKFAGAYGPMVKMQLEHVIMTLLKDSCSRQAGMTIWKPNPTDSKDIPCTVAVWFMIRGGRLNVHVFMRSSDVWLGLPYDLFSFSMLGLLVMGHLKNTMPWLQPGRIYNTGASVHLYAKNFEEARALVNEDPQPTKPVPIHLWRDPHALLETLKRLRDTRRGDPLRWWEV